MKGNHALFFIDRLELAYIVTVISPTRRALIVEVPTDVIPTESADLFA